MDDNFTIAFDDAEADETGKSSTPLVTGYSVAEFYQSDQKLMMVEAMRIYGGGFVKAIAEAFVRADYENFSRLCTAFPEYVEQYAKMSLEIKSRESNETKAVK